MHRITEVPARNVIAPDLHPGQDTNFGNDLILVFTHILFPDTSYRCLGSFEDRTLTCHNILDSVGGGFPLR